MNKEDSCAAHSKSDPATGTVQHLNPDTLASNPAFTQAVVVTGAPKTVYIGGQDAIDAAGALVGSDLKAQTEQILHNIEAALAAAGAGLEHVVKWNVYVVTGQPLQPAFEVFQRVWGRRANPPTITMVYVAGLANPDFLAEMDAIAVVPHEQAMLP